MNITLLQKQIQLLTDQINDIFHATQLNFDAIKIHLQINDNNHQQIHQSTAQKRESTNNQNTKPLSNNKSPHIAQLQKEYQKLKNAYKQRNNLRLEYLINQQIKSEQQKVRKQRLLEYEDKIYDHRRLICDKQGFYDSMLKPKVKRPPGMTVQQFQEYRYKQMQKEQKENFQQLQEETQALLKLEKMLRKHRITLQQEFSKYKKAKEDKASQQIEDIVQQQITDKKQQQIQGKQQSQKLSINNNQKQKFQQPNPKRLLQILHATPTAYQKLQPVGSLSSIANLQQIKKLLSQYTQISSSQQQIYKQYKQQKQMYKYLKWQQQQLVKKYKKLQQQIKQIRKEEKMLSSDSKLNSSVEIRNKNKQIQQNMVDLKNNKIFKKSIE